MNADGTWHLIINAPMGKQEAVAELRSDGSQLTGTVTNPGKGLTSDIFDGAVEGNELAWKVRLKRFVLTMAFTAKVEGDELTGSVKAGRIGTFPVTGRRV